MKRNRHPDSPDRVIINLESNSTSWIQENKIVITLSAVIEDNKDLRAFRSQLRRYKARMNKTEKQK